MTCKDLIESYADALISGSFCAELPNGRTSVILPFLYPDHDNIEVFVKDRGEEVVVSDLGETLRRLDTVGMDIGMSGKLAYQTERIAGGFGVVVHDGVLLKDGPRGAVGNLLLDVLSACMAIADLVYGTRAYQPLAFVDEVAKLLTVHKFEFQRNYESTGTLSGTKYRVDLKVTTQHLVSLVHTLDARTRAGVRQWVNATYRMWSEILTTDTVVRKVSLLNDEATRVREEDARLLEAVSHVYRWTERPRFLLSLQDGQQP
jgi:hypothetical protein